MGDKPLSLGDSESKGSTLPSARSKQTEVRGGWKVIQDSAPINGYFQIANRRGAIIARARTDWRADLIAAAPDLLDACYAAAILITEPARTREQEQRVLARLMAAIAKAEGES